jgi:hypothetical protein
MHELGIKPLLSPQPYAAVAAASSVPSSSQCSASQSNDSFDSKGSWLQDLEAKMGAVRAVVDDIQLAKSPSSPHRASSVHSVSNQASPVPSLHSAITHKAVGHVAVTAFAVTPAVGSPLRATPIRCDSSPDVDDDDGSLDNDSTASSSKIIAAQSKAEVYNDNSPPNTAQQHAMIVDQESKLTECSSLNVKSMPFKQQHTANKQQHDKRHQALAVHGEHGDVENDDDDVQSLSKSNLSSSSGVSSLSCDEQHLDSHSNRYDTEADVLPCPLTPPPLSLADDALHDSSSKKRSKSKSKSPKKHSVSSKLKKGTLHSNRLSLSGSSGAVRAGSSSNNNIKSGLESEANAPCIVSPTKQKKVNHSIQCMHMHVFVYILCN